MWISQNVWFTGEKYIYMYINGWSGGTPISGKPKYIELVAWLRQSRARDLRNSPHPTEDLHLSVHVPSPSGKLTVHWKKYRHFWREKSTWLVVSTPLKNISQLGWLFPIYGKIKNGNQTTNQISMCHGFNSWNYPKVSIRHCQPNGQVVAGSITNTMDLTDFKVMIKAASHENVVHQKALHLGASSQSQIFMKPGWL